MEITQVEYTNLTKVKVKVDEILDINKKLRRSKSFIRRKIKNDRLKKPRKQNRYIKKYNSLALTPMNELIINACSTFTLGLGLKAVTMVKQMDGILNQLKELRKEQENQNK